MRLLDAIVRREPTTGTEQRFSLDDLYTQMKYNGSQYLIGPSGSPPDGFDTGFVGQVQHIHERHGVVAAAVATRALLLSQVRFKWRRESDGGLFGNRDLRPLERPGVLTRPDLLARLEHDVSYSGTAFVVRRGDRLFRLAPDKTKFVLGSNDPSWDGDVSRPPFDIEVVGLTYDPGAGRDGSPRRVEGFGPGEFAVWAPDPDPLYPWRGLSWVSSVVREILLDGQATDHSGKFFEYGTTPSLIMLMDPSRSPDEIRAYADIVNRDHAGAENAYKNLYLGGATDAKVVGSSLDKLGLDGLRGTFENRVAVRSRVPAVILGTREALAGSSLNAGNYNSSRRLLADAWFTPTIDGLCASLEAIVPPPPGVELAHDPKRCLFLQEDAQDAANIQSTQMSAIRVGVDGGFDPASVVDAITTGDNTKLVHTGNVSVQLQPPGTGDAGRSHVLTGVVEREASMLPAIAPPAVNVTANIDARQDPPVVNVESPAVNVEPVFRMDAIESPSVVVNVEPAPVRVDNTVNVEPTPIKVDNTVDVSTPPAPPAQVTVIREEPSTYKVRRDSKGRINEVVEKD